MNPKIGEILKAERERKGLSLHEIGLNLKINARVLKAIEENETSQLPAKTFVRGFVRSYAQFLKLDLTEIMSLLDGNKTPPAPLNPPSSAVPTPEGDVESPVTPIDTKAFENPEPPANETSESKAARAKPRPIRNDASSSRMILGLGLVALVAAIVFVLKLIDKYQNESRRTQVQIRSTVDSKAASAEKAPEAAGVLPLTPGENTEIAPVETAHGSAEHGLATPTPATENLPAVAGGAPSAGASSGAANSAGATSSAAGSASHLGASSAATKAATPTPSPDAAKSTGHTIETHTNERPADTRPADARATGPSAVAAEAAHASGMTSAPPAASQSAAPQTTVASSPTAAPSATPSAAVAETPSATPSPSPKPANFKPVEVIVEALNKVDIRYSFGDGQYQTMSMAAEEIHTFKSKHGVQLEVSDGGSISVIVNGLERGVPGAVGQAIKLSYPK